MLKCQYCGTEKTKTGKPFKNQGSVNLHENRCASNPKNQDGANDDRETGAGSVEGTQTAGTTQTDQAGEECQHDWMPIRLAIKKARSGRKMSLLERLEYIQQHEGAKKICVECGEYE